MAKILVTENVHPVGPDLLKAAGHQVVFADRDMDIIRREIVDADAVFVRIIDLDESRSEVLFSAMQTVLVSYPEVIFIIDCKKPLEERVDGSSRGLLRHRDFRR